jgi:hypothetical protein
VTQIVCAGAKLACSMGSAPSTFAPTPRPDTVGGKVVGTVLDCKPIANIPAFGMCQSPSNPQVATATAAANGVLTPQPCSPLLPAPWTLGSTSTKVGGQPALLTTSSAACQWGGKISVTAPGQIAASAI